MGKAFWGYILVYCFAPSAMVNVMSTWSSFMPVDFTHEIGTDTDGYKVKQLRMVIVLQGRLNETSPVELFTLTYMSLMVFQSSGR